MVGPGIAKTGVTNNRCGGYTVKAREVSIGDSRCPDVGGHRRYRAFLGEHPRKSQASKVRIEVTGLVAGAGFHLLQLRFDSDAAAKIARVVLPNLSVSLKQLIERMDLPRPLFELPEDGTSSSRSGPGQANGPHSDRPALALETARTPHIDGWWSWKDQSIP